MHVACNPKRVTPMSHSLSSTNRISVSSAPLAMPSHPKRTFLFYFTHPGIARGAITSLLEISIEVRQRQKPMGASRHQDSTIIDIPGPVRHSPTHHPTLSDTQLRSPISPPHSSAHIPRTKSQLTSNALRHTATQSNIPTTQLSSRPTHKISAHVLRTPTHSYAVQYPHRTAQLTSHAQNLSSRPTLSDALNRSYKL